VFLTHGVGYIAEVSNNDWVRVSLIVS